MLKKLIRENQKVILVDGNSEPFSALLITGKIFDEKQEERILTDGESRLISGNKLEIYDYHWVIFINGKGIRKIEVNKKWLSGADITSISFIDLCLVLKAPGVFKIRFNSDRAEIISSHFTPIITDFSINGIPPGEYWLALFDNCNKPLSAGKIIIKSNSNFSMANGFLDIHTTKGYLVKV